MLSDGEIEQLAMAHGMIEPFVPHKVGGGKISYGLSSYGYDARVCDMYKLFRSGSDAVIDPKSFPAEECMDVVGESCIIPPNGFALARTVEYFRVPRDVIAICVGKSTYARCGVIVNVTPLEPGWEGYVTIEISNTTPMAARIYSHEGICQFIFFKASGRVCRKSYSDVGGKYMYQKEIVLPHV